MGTFEQDKKESAVIDVSKIKDLCAYLVSLDYEQKKWISAFSDFCESIERIMYNEITDFIYGITDEEASDMDKRLHVMYGTIKSTIDNMNANENNEWLRFFIRFFDHCMLALSQRELYLRSSSAIENKVNESGKNITGQLIGLVSIFTALSFVVFGGINILSNVLNNIRYLSDMIYAGSIWLWVVGNLFVTFMHFILLMTDKIKGFNVKAYLLAVNIVPFAVIAFVYFTERQLY